jgi:NAD(P)-dependent dehydrogenase (short-subunit alcohol dehydrogenase family)
MSLHGKVAVITGAASGLGRGFALAFVKEGAHVVVADVDDKGAFATVEACKDIRHNSAVAVHCDVTKRDHLQEAIMAGKAHFGRELDIMVNNAGIAVNDGEMSSPARWKKMVQINLVAVIEGTHLAIEAMQAKAQPGGVVLNISSMAGIYPQFLTPVYSAVKSGVAMFTRSLKQLEHSNIRVVALAPNFVETPIIEGIRDYLVTTTSRILTVEEVADCALELVRDDKKQGGGAVLQIAPTQKGTTLRAYWQIDAPKKPASSSSASLIPKAKL